MAALPAAGPTHDLPSLKRVRSAKTFVPPFPTSFPPRGDAVPVLVYGDPVPTTDVPVWTKVMVK